jgi:hypothetical protein
MKKLKILNLIIVMLFISFFVLGSNINYQSLDFVNKDNFTIKLIFNEPSKILVSKINQTPISFLPTNSFYNTHYNYTTSINTEGIYVLNLSAQNENQNKFENEFYNYIFVFDKTKPILESVFPINNSIITTKNKQIRLIFNEQIEFESCDLKFIRGQGNYEFIQNNNNHKIIDISLVFNEFNQNYMFNVSCSDLAGNIKNTILNYKVRIFDIIMIKPNQFGYSSTEEFDIVFNTTIDASCSYYNNYDNKNINTLQDSEFTKFPISNKKTHQIKDFSLIEEFGKREFFVSCNYTLGDTINKSKKLFNLNVDTKPLIMDVVASDVISSSLLSDINIQLNKDANCRYSVNVNQDFSKMIPIDNDEFKSSFKISDNVSNEKEYTYYITCKSKAGITNSKSVSFVVDTDLNIKINFIKPEKNYYSINNQEIHIQTSHDSSCSYSLNSMNNITTLFGTFGKTHKAQVSFLDGTNKLWISCFFTSQSGDKKLVESKEITIDKIKPIINNINVTQPNTPKGIFWNNNRIYVKINVTVNKSGIGKIYYMINSSDNTYSSGWIEKNKIDTFLDKNSENNNLNLVYNKSYYVAVKVMSGAELFSDIKKSDNLYLNKSLVPLHCLNNKIDADYETDTDCGFLCPPCEEDGRCRSDNDCVSGNCILVNGIKRCTKPTCDDNKQNQDETDIDCGGICATNFNFKCSVGNSCLQNNDCSSNLCKNNVCAYVDLCSNGVKDPSETDVDCGGVCSNKCNLNEGCNIKDDCKGNLICENGLCVYPEVEDFNPPPTSPTNESNMNQTTTGETTHPSFFERNRIWLIILIIILIIIILLILLYLIFRGKEIVIANKKIVIPNYFKNNASYKQPPQKQDYVHLAQFKPVNTTNNKTYYQNTLNTKEMIDLIRQKREEQLKREHNLINNKYVKKQTTNELNKINKTFSNKK